MSRELKIQEFDDKHLCHPHAPQIQKVKRLQVIVLWQCKLTKQELELTMQSVALALNENYLKIAK